MKATELVVGAQYRMANGRDCVIVKIDMVSYGPRGVLVRTGDHKERWVGPSAIKERIDYVAG